MRITSVSVRRLKTLEGYNNIAIEATSPVDEGEDPQVVRQEVDMWVQAQLEKKSVQTLRTEAETLEWRVSQLMDREKHLSIDVDALRQHIERLKKTPLEQLAAGNVEETPF